MTEDEIQELIGALPETFTCPACGDEGFDNMVFDSEGLAFPVCSKGESDWIEIHYCQYCDQKYWFVNGC